MAISVPSHVRTDVNETLRDLAQTRGVTTDSLTEIDIQGCAYGWRIAANERKRDPYMLEVAKIFDALSVLDESALSYLEDIAGPPLTTLST